MKFSQRIGEVETEKVAQLGSIDIELSVGLWNAVTNAGLKSGVRSFHADPFFKRLTEFFFKWPVDEISTVDWKAKQTVKDWYFEQAEWHEQYDFIEFIVNRRFNVSEGLQKRAFLDRCTHHLNTENSAYRFIGGELTEITSPEEIQEVESALTDTQGFAGVKTHLARALTLMNDRESPDYRNSIKESISAVECLVMIITGEKKAGLTKALAILEQRTSLHHALKESFKKLYAYTSDASGIRHALTEDDSEPSKTEARFMLIACSAFVNYSKSIISGSHI